MPRDDNSSLQLGFLIKFIEPDLNPEEIEAETQYLLDDLLDLSGMGQTRFRFLRAERDELQFRSGLQFEAAPDRLKAILRRLCDRLDDIPLETLVLIYYGQVRLQIQTHRSEELADIFASAKALLPPDSIYLAKAETYVHTRGELSPAEKANLDLLAQELELSPEEAEKLNTKAMGPFKSLQEKLEHFSTVVTDELSQASFPPNQETREVLSELAENLGIPKNKADAVYQEHLQTVQAMILAHQAEVEAKQKQTDEDAQKTIEAQARAEQTLHNEKYRDLFRRAIQNSLYPLTFDQGRLEQTRKLWKIPKATAEQIEEEVRTELYGGIQSAADIDYTRLRQLLSSHSWRQADQETENVMLKALSKDMQPLNREAFMRLDCVDLLTIDQLWGRHSQGQFGFQTQYQIFQDAERRPADFQRLLEWRVNTFNLQGDLKSYKDLIFSLKAPKGHLPTWRWCCPSIEGGYDISDAIVEAFFLRFAQCRSGQNSSAAGSGTDQDPPIARSQADMGEA